jgi:hemolysin activation/secretion protein
MVLRAAALFAALLLLMPSAAPAAEPEAPAAAAPAAPPLHVEGFRSAHWGMTEPQVRAAIVKDFKIAPDKVKSEENLAERTQVLTVLVSDLLEGAGPARVSYIFGYTSKKLIEVNVLWGTAIDPQVASDKIVAAADQLRQLLVDSGYDTSTIVTNARLNDGEVLVFKGQDAAKHTTILRLAAAHQSPRRSAAKLPTTVTALALSYILDAQNPDIYRLRKGQF